MRRWLSARRSGSAVRRKTFGWWAVVGAQSLAFAALAPGMSMAACRLGKLAELPVTMNGMQPLIHAKINGEDAMFIADSGAFFSMITPGSAAQYNLKLFPAPMNLRVVGIGGTMDASIARVKEFTIAGVPIRNIEFIVGGSEVGGSASVGLLGQNFFRVADVEYDLAQGAIRLMKAEDCSHARLAYWVKADQPYSVMEIAWATPAAPHTMGFAYLNGAKIRVMFDSGASNSLLSMKAAERAGLKPDSTGVTDAGYSSGIGREYSKTYIGTFSSFKIGEEEIRNARLRFGDIHLETDMLLGADFFLSHRIYVASSQRKLYFTYNGGAVFNLSAAAAPAHPSPAAALPHAPAVESKTPTAQSARTDTSAANAPPGNMPAADPNEPSTPTAPSGEMNTSAASTLTEQSAQMNPSAANTAAAGTANGPAADELPDAAAYSRRGMARAARHESDRALADLTRACELAPDNAEYHYQRGVIYRNSNQLAAAMRDFDRALELKGDDVAILAARAQLRFTQHDVTGARADLALADHTASKESDLRLFLAHGYAGAGDLQAAIGQLDLWIAAHPADARMVDALHGRCNARAWLDKDLSEALRDCDHALRQSSGAAALNAEILQDRGLVRLRLGDYAKSVSDYDASLKLAPDRASALYGRGIAKLRMSRRPDGESDIAAAVKINPKVEEYYRQHGLLP